MTLDEWLCTKCGSEVGAFECWDGTLVGYFCIRSALREADTAPPELDATSFEERWRHLHLGRGDA